MQPVDRTSSAAAIALALTLALVGPASGGCARERKGPPAPAPAATPVAAPAATPGAVAASLPPPVPASFPPPGCTVDVEAPAHTPRGQTGIARITVRASEGYRVSREAPFDLLIASNDLDLVRARLGAGDAVWQLDHVRFEVPFSSRVPGAKRASVHARFGICGDARCAECRQRSEFSTQVD